MLISSSKNIIEQLIMVTWKPAYLKNPIVKRGCEEQIVSSSASPEVGASHKGGDVQNDDALQLRQRYPLTVAFQLHALTKMSRGRNYARINTKPNCLRTNPMLIIPNDFKILPMDNSFGAEVFIWTCFQISRKLFILKDLKILPTDNVLGQMLNLPIGPVHPLLRAQHSIPHVVPCPRPALLRVLLPLVVKV